MSVSELNKENRSFGKNKEFKITAKGKRQLTFISNAYLKSKGTGFIRCLNFGTFLSTCDSYIVKPAIRRRWYLGSHDKRRVCATCEEWHASHVPTGVFDSAKQCGCGGRGQWGYRACLWEIRHIEKADSFRNWILQIAANEAKKSIGRTSAPVRWNGKRTCLRNSTMSIMSCGMRWCSWTAGIGM